MSTQRDKAKAATAEKVAEAARELFLAHGYEAVTIRNIAAKVGMSVGAVFSNYEDKDALFLACMGRPSPPVALPPFLDRLGSCVAFDAEQLHHVAEEAAQLRRDILGAGA